MLEKLQTIIADQIGIDADTITENSNFKEDLKVDSLDMFEMLMAIDDEFGIEIPADDLENLATVKDIMDYLKSKGAEE
ncbi:MAG: acyl carrier protein [Lachnospiraceae bacterium]